MVVRSIFTREMLRRVILRSRCIIQTAHLRSLSKLSVDLKENPNDRMQAWQIHSYNGLKDLRLSNVRMPLITNPNDVLVKIEAASVNPIDIAMTSTSFLLDCICIFCLESGMRNWESMGEGSRYMYDCKSNVTVCSSV